MTLFQAIILAIVEGITEYLPVSSTGHMVVTSSLMGIAKDEFTKVFEVAVQLGAILAVVVLYWRKFFNFQRWQFYVKLIIAVIPALVLGLLFSDKIDELLESPTTVAITLLLGGVVLLFIDKIFSAEGAATNVQREEDMSMMKAFMVGLWQCIAMIPGVSRSAASIIGGMQQKLTRKLAAEFSFFLAVPTMCAASGYSLFLKETGPAKQKGYELILSSSNNLYAFIVGNIVAFVVAMLAIRFFIGFLQRKGFRIFGWYRIIAGIVLLVLTLTGVITSM
jgi:undecaprenyl-diphosphatase